MQNRSDVCSKLKNKVMDSETFPLRTRVMSFIYEAKKLIPSLPRITVRITDDSKDGVMGVARMGGNIIWITEKFVCSRSTVFHEILHAVYKQEHVAGCPLMDAKDQGEISKEECERLFKKYAQAAKKKGG